MCLEVLGCEGVWAEAAGARDAKGSRAAQTTTYGLRTGRSLEGFLACGQIFGVFLLYTDEGSPRMVSREGRMWAEGSAGMEMPPLLVEAFDGDDELLAWVGRCASRGSAGSPRR